MKNVQLALVDDDTLIVALLSDFFSQQDHMDVLFTANSGEALLDSLPQHQPDILILDLKMEGKSGLDILPILKEEYPDIKTIIMSSHYKTSFMGFMLKTGACAFIPKGVSPKDLLQIVNEVHKKGYYFKPEQLETIRGQVANHVPEPVLDSANSLSEREIEVLKLICLQKTAQEIGDQLFIAKRTVEGHKNNLFLKTDTKNIAGLAIYAIQHNLVALDELMLHNLND